MNRIVVISLGYVSLPTAVVFASRGFEVVGVDVDEGKVKAVNEVDAILGSPNSPNF